MVFNGLRLCFRLAQLQRSPAQPIFSRRNRQSVIRDRQRLLSKPISNQYVWACDP